MLNNTSMLVELEKTLQVNFINKELLIEALTHSSYVNSKIDIKHYERLEFLGDAVLELCISDYLFHNYTEKSEGQLTKSRALIVCEPSLFEIAQSLKLGEFMLMSKGEELTGGRTRPSILADCVEAIIAAIYLDGGLDKAKAFIIKNFESTIKKAMLNKVVLDYKTKLQELLQQNGQVAIVYNVIGYDGPPHRRLFNTEVSIDNEVKGSGSGFTKKEAEQNAAKAALEALEERNE
jgi:ribonuclease-3